jgi:hypothetical protein
MYLKRREAWSNMFWTYLREGNFIISQNRKHSTVQTCLMCHYEPVIFRGKKGLKNYLNA